MRRTRYCKRIGSINCLRDVDSSLPMPPLSGWGLARSTYRERSSITAPGAGCRPFLLSAERQLLRPKRVESVAVSLPLHQVIVLRYNKSMRSDFDSGPGSVSNHNNTHSLFYSNDESLENQQVNGQTVREQREVKWGKTMEGQSPPLDRHFRPCYSTVAPRFEDGIPCESQWVQRCCRRVNGHRPIQSLIAQWKVWKARLLTGSDK